MRPEQPEQNRPEPTPDDLPRARVVRRGPGPKHLKRLVRASLLAVGVALIGVFAAAATIRPYEDDGTPKRMSTHTQLGMPPCNFVVLSGGKPCPSCGMTTSFAFLVRGDVLNSLRANWVGTLIAVIWAATMVWALASAARGRMLLIPRRPGAGEAIFTALAGLVVVLMLARWGVIMLSD